MSIVNFATPFIGKCHGKCSLSDHTIFVGKSGVGTPLAEFASDAPVAGLLAEKGGPPVAYGTCFGDHSLSLGLEINMLPENI